MATPSRCTTTPRGNDHLFGGDGSTNSLYGDAQTMDGDSRGGNDTLIAATVRSTTSMATPFHVWQRPRRQRHADPAASGIGGPVADISSCDASESTTTPRRQRPSVGGAGSFIFLVGDAGIHGWRQPRRQ